MTRTYATYLAKPALIACGLLAILGLPPAARAEPTEFPPSKLYATAWGLTLASDGTGFYNELGHYVMTGMGLDYDIEPYRRAMRRFYDDPSSCVYPKSVSALVRTRDVDAATGFIESIPIQKTFVALFTPRGAPLISSADDLAGKRVAYAMGSKVPDILGADGAFFIAVANEVDKARMLVTGRVDVMVGNLPDADIVYRHLGEELPPFDPGFTPFPTARSRVVCHDTPGSRVFMERLNKRLRMLHASGDLARFYEKHGLDPHMYLDAVLPTHD